MSDVKKIPAQNPTKEEMAQICAAVTEEFAGNVTTSPVTFNFKKGKDEATGETFMREAVDLAIPVPNADGIVAILEAGGKLLELLLSAMEDVVTTQARKLISDDHTLNASNLPYEQLSWGFISNIPKASRTGGGIPKEVWEAFGADYIEVMQEAAGKTVEQATNAARMLTGKFAACKTNEKVLSYLVEQLSIYADTSSNVETYLPCVEFLLKKADALLNVSDEDLLANL